LNLLCNLKTTSIVTDYLSLTQYSYNKCITGLCKVKRPIQSKSMQFQTTLQSAPNYTENTVGNKNVALLKL